jgi:hypothetical protein
VSKWNQWWAQPTLRSLTSNLSPAMQSILGVLLITAVIFVVVWITGRATLGE